MLKTVIFKQYADAPVTRKFTSLFPGLGYAAGYKVGNPRKNLKRQDLTVASDSTTDLQIWWTAFCPRLPGEEPRDRIRQCVRQRHWESHHACHSRESDWHRRDRPPTPRCPQDQAANEPRGLPRPWRLPNCRRRRNGPIPRSRLDRGSKCPWFICCTLNPAAPLPPLEPSLTQNSTSYSVAPRSQNNTSTHWKTTTAPPGSKTSSPASAVPPPPWSSPHPSTSSRPAYRTGTSRTPRAVSG